MRLLPIILVIYITYGCDEIPPQENLPPQWSNSAVLMTQVFENDIEIS